MLNAHRLLLLAHSIPYHLMVRGHRHHWRGLTARSLRFASLARSFARSFDRSFGFVPRYSFVRSLHFISSRKQLDFEDGDPFGDGYDDDDDDDGEAGGGAARHYGAEHVLLLLDCDASMFERYVACRRPPPSPTDDDDDRVDPAARGPVLRSPMDVAATAAHRLLRAKVRDVAETRCGKRDGVGVLLYGCDPYRRRRLRRRRGGGVGGGGGGWDDGVEDVVVDDDGEDDDDEGDEDPLPTTHELVELAAPGIEQVLTVQECLPDEDEGGDDGGDRGLRRRRRSGRDLRGEFSSAPRRRREGGDDGGGGGDREEGAEEGDGTPAVCSLCRGLTAALKIFGSAK